MVGCTTLVVTIVTLTTHPEWGRRSLAGPSLHISWVRVSLPRRSLTTHILNEGEARISKNCRNIRQYATTINLNDDKLGAQQVRWSVGIRAASIHCMLQTSKMWLSPTRTNMRIILNYILIVHYQQSQIPQWVHNKTNFIYLCSPFFWDWRGPWCDAKDDLNSSLARGDKGNAVSELKTSPSQQLLKPNPTNPFLKNRD